MKNKHWVMAVSVAATVFGFGGATLPVLQAADLPQPGYTESNRRERRMGISVSLIEKHFSDAMGALAPRSLR